MNSAKRLSPDFKKKSGTSHPDKNKKSIYN